tara:strand:- start:746 stop:1519 length:774 start_codon:yes stop_codon:yes gene_type:complete
MTYNFPNVSLLITHYNRSESLERLLSSFQKLGIIFGKIVVSDDCSAQKHLDYIKQLHDKFQFELVSTPENKGLGNNINKGQDLIKTPYTLYVQEDFVPKELFSKVFSIALGFMEKDHNLDIVRFYAYFKYPKLIPFGQGFSEMKFSSWNFNHLKFYLYSDHPHLKRSNFREKFGRYAENCHPNKTEFSMCLNFLKYNASGLFYEEFTTVFDQKNSSHEPSTIGRAAWRTQNNVPVKSLRSFYLVFRYLKNTIELALK